MAKLTASQVEHVAKLANLPIITKETSQFQKQLSEVVEYVGEISKVRQREATRPASQNSKLEHRQETRTREDEVDMKQCLTQEQAVSGTKSVHNGLFVAPHVFGEK